MPKNIQTINPSNPASDIINKAAQIIINGGIVAFPTMSLYGLAADAFNKDAVGRIFEIKNRPGEKPILVLIKDRGDLSDLVTDIPPAAVTIMDKLWPGEITLVFKAKNTLPENLTAGSGKIGIRIPIHNVASALVKAVGRPVTGTSANLSSGIGCSQISEMNPIIKSNVDFSLDAGPLKGGKGSTVIDVTVDPPRILREGRYSEKEIMEII
ncbi:MAG: threonylcarbamoyl-AMP synthase [Desulfobacterales bacterium]|jgi:L-threonylcarbamoyladenylate synthase|nr:threonylcarbamoyl-AMP synthase [Desulfobacteraceae bacterium]MBT4363358.1 threonylcarbamoyl-AMP synthase [Desulfobacteraceae bacterium]MBT7084647.1 threonylcarbamoyl-AMP synthase [Desulfobacterales bacterium]MBT7698210.1 threonylcarbamoyl-AMP synthase [Desulfobacterales bacterium]